MLAIAGIGNPENFFKLMKENKLDVRKKLIFPDHHKFLHDEIKEIIDEAKKEDLYIIMTEKRLFQNEQTQHMNYLKVSLEILKKTSL